MKLIPTIIWEKWVDPFGDDTKEAKWTDYNNELNELDYDENYPSIIKIPEKPVKVLATPLGLVPYNEHTASSKIFNFWMGHTNFDISNTIKEVIEKTDGVEILDIFTRYRFRIAIGKCFTDSNVMTSIKDGICKYYETT
jgi:hypothetical protein